MSRLLLHSLCGWAGLFVSHLVAKLKPPKAGFLMAWLTLSLQCDTFLARMYASCKKTHLKCLSTDEQSVLSLFCRSTNVQQVLALKQPCVQPIFDLWYLSKYHNVPKFSDRQVWATSADPDQTARGAVWSGSTLFAIPSASFGCITLRKSHLIQLLGWLPQIFWCPKF